MNLATDNTDLIERFYPARKVSDLGQGEVVIIVDAIEFHAGAKVKRQDQEEINHKDTENRGKNKDPQFMVTVHFRNSLNTHEGAGKYYDEVKEIEMRKHASPRLIRHLRI